MPFVLVEFEDEAKTQAWAELDERRVFVCMRDATGAVIPAGQWPHYAYLGLGDVQPPWVQS